MNGLRRSRRLAAVLAAGAVIAAIPATHAAAAVSPATRVTPKGDYISLSVPATYVVHERVSGTDTTCTAASKPTLPLGTNAKNQIPVDGNPAAGPVVIPITKLNVGNCTNSAPGVLVSVRNTGGWKLLLRHKDTVDAASLVIPKNGSIVSLYIGAAGVFCMAIAAPNEPVVVRGKWHNGNPSTFTVTDAQIPATGIGNPPCPQGTVTASISLTVVVTNVSHPDLNVRID